MNISDFILNWILNWILFRSDSMQKWILKKDRPPLRGTYLNCFLHLVVFGLFGTLLLLIFLRGTRWVSDMVLNFSRNCQIKGHTETHVFIVDPVWTRYVDWHVAIWSCVHIAHVACWKSIQQIFHVGMYFDPNQCILVISQKQTLTDVKKGKKC